MKLSPSAFILAAWLALSAPLAAQPTINLNIASQTELETLKGVGPAKARAIVEYREKHGPFKSVAELDKVKGFGKASIEKLASQVSVGAAAPPPRKQQSQ